MTMVSLFRAEWHKALANFKLIGFLVWIFPLGILSFYLVMILGSLVSETMMSGVEFFSSGDWTKDGLSAWNMLILFPANLFGRMLPLAFMSVVFAGEYQWRTQKNIVPRTRRWMLLVAKMAVLISVVMVSMILTVVVASLGPMIGYRLHGLPYGPTFSWQIMGDFVLDTLRIALVAVLALLNLVGYAAVATLVTRSILGGLLISMGFAVLDSTSLGFILFLRRLFGKPELINLYQFTPSYNLSNLHAWLFTGKAQQFITAGVSPLTAEPSFWISLLILGTWIAGTIGLSIWLFQRQEITE
jgi:hypothetical protein